MILAGLHRRPEDRVRRAARTHLPGVAGLAVTSAHRPTALDRLPHQTLDVPDLDADPAWRLAAAFLVGFRASARRPTSTTSEPGTAGAPRSVSIPFQVRRHHVDR